MYTRHKRSTFMINKDTTVYHCNTSIFMINKDDYFSTNIYIMALSESSLKNAKWLKIRLSIPAESKIVEKTLEPADEGS